MQAIKINANTLVTYNLKGDAEKVKQAKRAKKMQHSNKALGVVTSKTLRTAKKYLNPFLETLFLKKIGKNRYILQRNKNVTFVTLTLPSKQIHNDKFIKRHALNRFLKWLINEKNTKNYFWRAERQVNGNIHFHLLMDKRIDSREIRLEWNRILDEYGYIDAYSEKMKKLSFDDYLEIRRNEIDKGKTVDEIRKAYEKGLNEGWRNPNSTDIRSLKKVNNVKAYILKYMTKSEETTQKDEKSVKPIEGKWYGKSQNLEKLQTTQFVLDTEMKEYLIGALNNRGYIVKYKNDKYFSVFTLKYNWLRDTFFSEVIEMYEKIYLHNKKILS